jgi:hypothetical protein
MIDPKQIMAEATRLRTLCSLPAESHYGFCRTAAAAGVSRYYATKKQHSPWPLKFELQPPFRGEVVPAGTPNCMEHCFDKNGLPCRIGPYEFYVVTEGRLEGRLFDVKGKLISAESHLLENGDVVLSVGASPHGWRAQSTERDGHGNITRCLTYAENSQDPAHVSEDYQIAMTNGEVQCLTLVQVAPDNDIIIYRRPTCSWTELLEQYRVVLVDAIDRQLSAARRVELYCVALTHGSGLGLAPPGLALGERASIERTESSPEERWHPLIYTDFPGDQELMLAPEFPQGDSLSEIVRSVRSDREFDAVEKLYERVAQELNLKWKNNPIVFSWDEGDDDPLPMLERTLSSQQLAQLRAQHLID